MKITDFESFLLSPRASWTTHPLQIRTNYNLLSSELLFCLLFFDHFDRMSILFGSRQLNEQKCLFLVLELNTIRVKYRSTIWGDHIPVTYGATNNNTAIFGLNTHITYLPYLTIYGLVMCDRYGLKKMESLVILKVTYKENKTMGKAGERFLKKILFSIAPTRNRW